MKFLVRFLNLIAGLMLYSIGIIITIKANIGYAPWDVFHVGLSKTIGLSLGTVAILFGIILLILLTILGEKFGLGTVLNTLLIGIFLDLILKLDIIPSANNYLVGVIMLISGLFIISLGSFFYIKSAFGVGPRDNLMVVLAKKTKIPVGICRTAIELVVTLSGWLLGGMVGFGTVISMFAIGFCVQFTFYVLKFDVTAVKHESLLDTYRVLFGKKNNS